MTASEPTYLYGPLSSTKRKHVAGRSGEPLCSTGAHLETEERWTDIWSRWPIPPDVDAWLSFLHALPVCVSCKRLARSPGKDVA